VKIVYISASDGEKVVYLLRVFYTPKDRLSRGFMTTYMIKFIIKEKNEDTSEIKYILKLTDPNYLRIDDKLNNSDKPSDEYFKHAEVLRDSIEISNVELLLYSKSDIFQRIINEGIDFAGFADHAEKELDKAERYYKEKGYIYEYGK
jgi:hypothetical protein